VLEIAFEYPPDSFSGDVACRDVIVTAQVRQFPAELIHVFCALEIYPKRHVFIDREIVNSSEMKYRSYFFADIIEIFVRDPELRKCDVAFDNRKVFERRTRIFGETF
jgi:hypothetical protein